MPTLRVTDALPATLKANALILGVTEENKSLKVHGIPATAAKPIAAALQAIGADASPNGVWRVPAPSGFAAESIIAVGVIARPGTEQLRMAAGAAARSAASCKAVAVALPATTPDHLRAVTEGILLGAHPHHAYLSKDKPRTAAITITSQVPRAARTKIKRAAEITAAATCLARDLVNEPPGHLPPAELAARARFATKDVPVTCEVWDVKRLTKEGMGGILAVGQGSANPPRLIRLGYRPRGATKTIAFVGKGITFDSGGLSIKPAKSMETMKMDMGGAAAVLAATVAIAQLGLKVNVTGYMACAENMPSGTAQRPGDVITQRGGKTVEVLNTDAEGRLVLADALALASDSEPDVIVDVATLTGAQMIALGSHVAAVMSNDAELPGRLVAAGAEVGEPLWHMPLPEALRSSLKTPVADLKNIGEQMGGMLVAGLFLSEFVPADQPWAHLDIAGPAYNSGAEHGFTGTGGTGFAARTLIQFAADSA